MNNKKNWYLFMGRIALEYRLSLNGICELLNMEKTDENRKEIYDTIMSNASTNFNLERMYKYLFNYETLSSNEEASKQALRGAGNFLKAYIFSRRANNEELRNQLIASLSNTEKAFKEVIKKDFKNPLTEEDILAISKYRIKHCISRMGMSDMLDLSRDRLADNEKKISDEIVRYKLQSLSEYYQDMKLNKYRGR